MDKSTRQVDDVLAGTVQAEVREHTFRWTTANPVGHPIPMGGQKFANCEDPRQAEAGHRQAQCQCGSGLSKQVFTEIETVRAAK